MIGKVFKAYDVRAVYPRPLNEKIAWQVGHASASYLMSEAARAMQPTNVTGNWSPPTPPPAPRGARRLLLPLLLSSIS